MENQITAPIPDMTNWKTFVFVCDGEVAEMMKLPPVAERMIAVLSSNPTVIEINSNQSVQIGDLYKDGRFSKP